MSDVEDVFVSDEAEMPEQIYRGKRPSKEAVEARSIIHLPYCSWRPHCARGKA